MSRKAPPTMVFKNLRAEMVKRELTIKDVADGIGVPYPTLYNHLVGDGEPHLKEAYAIQRKFFPGLSIDYLYAEYAHPVRDISVVNIFERINEHCNSRKQRGNTDCDGCQAVSVCKARADELNPNELMTVYDAISGM